LYNWLFEQLETAKEASKTEARNELLRAIEAAHDKLIMCYSKKIEGDTGTFYSLGAILNPSTKLSSI
jgi:hypothetical protein